METEKDNDWKLLRDFGLFKCERCGSVKPLAEAGLLASMPPSLNNGGHADVCFDCAE